VVLLISINNLEERVAAIEACNSKVDLDKAWESSWTRRLSIASLTYLVVVVYLSYIGNNSPYINAFVPAVGFLLSTLVLPQICSFWQKSQK